MATGDCSGFVNIRLLSGAGSPNHLMRSGGLDEMRCMDDRQRQTDGQNADSPDHACWKTKPLWKCLTVHALDLLNE
jgi:hypothetical protein